MSKIYTFLQIIQEKTLFLENLLPPVMTVTTNVTSESDKSYNQSNMARACLYVLFNIYQNRSQIIHHKEVQLGKKLPTPPKKWD